MSNFKEALKNKLRFKTNRGLVTTEDIFDLTDSQLDSLYKDLKKQIRSSQEESLLKTKSSEDKTTELSIKLVEEIYNDRVLEREKATQERERKEKRRKLLERLHEIEEGSLKNLSKEEILKQLGELE